MKKLALVLILAAVPFLAQEEIKYTRDKNGRITRVDYSNGRAIVYTYDASGNLIRREFIVPEPPPAESEKKDTPPKTRK